MIEVDVIVNVALAAVNIIFLKEWISDKNTNKIIKKKNCSRNLNISVCKNVTVKQQQEDCVAKRLAAMQYL